MRKASVVIINLHNGLANIGIIILIIMVESFVHSKKGKELLIPSSHSSAETKSSVL